MPKGWLLSTSGNRVLADGKGTYLVTWATRRNDTGRVLAGINWQRKRFIWTQEVEWEPRSATLFADGKRLIIGSSNKTFYEFDFDKIRNGG